MLPNLVKHPSEYTEHDESLLIYGWRMGKQDEHMRIQRNSENIMSGVKSEEME